MYSVKKKMNSLLSLFLLITLLCAPLTGCSGTNTPEDSQNPISTETESNSDVESESASTTESDTTTESATESETDSTTQTPDDSQKPDNSEPTESQPSESEKPSDSENPGNSENPENSENPGTTEEPTEPDNPGTQTGTDMDTPGISLSDIPAYNGTHYIVLNNNVPHFATNNLSTKAFEYYSELDSLGRCGIAYACLGKETMPEDGEKRGSISSVKPTGWIQKQYDTSIVKTRDIYNRSHLIAWSLSAENANKQNLITGTPQLNQTNMTKFEDMVLDHIKETGNHVAYRVTPYYEGNNLVATGVQMEAWSIEDNGDSICFNVFIYNAQDGVIIDYATGESRAENETGTTEPDDSETESQDPSSEVPDGAKYAVNGNNGKIHVVGACTATEEGHSSAMKNPIYFDTYEEALAYVKEHHPDQKKIDCGNCFK